MVACFFVSKNAQASELIYSETNQTYNDGNNLNNMSWYAGRGTLMNFNSGAFNHLYSIEYRLGSLTNPPVCGMVYLYTTSIATSSGLVATSSTCQIGNLDYCGLGCTNAQRQQVAYYFDYEMELDTDYYIDISPPSGHSHSVDFSLGNARTSYYVYGDYTDSITLVQPENGKTYKDFTFWQTQVSINTSYPSYVIQVQYSTTSEFFISDTDISTYYPVSQTGRWSFPKTKILPDDTYYAITRLFDNEANELASSSIQFTIDNINGSSTFITEISTSTNGCFLQTSSSTLENLMGYVSYGWCNAVLYLFTPTNLSKQLMMNYYDTIKTVPPIGYFTQASSSLASISYSTSSKPVLMQTSLIQQMANPIRSLTTWIFPVMFLVYLFLRLKHFFR